MFLKLRPQLTMQANYKRNQNCNEQNSCSSDLQPANMSLKFLLCAVALFAVGALAKDFDVTVEVTFRLFTQNNKFEWENLGFDADNLTAAGFDFNKETKFMTHGFMNNGSGMSCIAVRDAYLEHYDVNFIIVDYDHIASDVIWTQPLEKIEMVGEYTASFIDFLLEEGYDANKLHLLGHSLGAHVIGNAARHVTNGRIPRVTGLDPGLMGDDDERLDTEVADFVDIIHTCRGVYGMISSIGHADFYPNGGFAIQPSCDTLGGVTCSHYEAVWYFVRSIHVAQRYPSHLCDSEIHLEDGECNDNPVAYMGIDVDPSTRGDYYLKTEDESESLRG